MAMADSLVKKSRKSNFSPEEIEVLVKTVGKHYNVLYGEFAKRAVNKQARSKAWINVTRQVNRVSIEKRTLQEVKNKWKKCQHLYKDQDNLRTPDDFDSMPLEQRLYQTPVEQEPVLQSQPLSPTKLKVTRQAAKPFHISPKPTTPEPPNEEVCLRWNSHHSNMQSTFPNILLREHYVDATLVAEGQTLKCHRLILSSCSPYFEDVLSEISQFQHPVIFMKDIPFWVLKCLCDFMYAGEVHIYQNKLEELLAVAEILKIKGLAGKSEGANDEISEAKLVGVKLENEKVAEKKTEKGKDKKKHPHQFTPQQAETTLPAPKSSSKITRSSYVPKKNPEKAEKVHREPIRDDMLDPLDLLEPVYEEVTKESKPAQLTKQKFKDRREGSVKKPVAKKLKKRKLSEERDETPPPLFQSRKGTRSRPHVKIPKYYHFGHTRKSMEFSESAIVCEHHTDQADPLMYVEEIKIEPLDLEDVIEIEDNVVSFSDQEILLQEEEIIGNYDSPIVNLAENESVDDKQETCKKINLSNEPVIMDVSEQSLNTLKIVDVSQLTCSKDVFDGKCVVPAATESLILESEINKSVIDPLNVQSRPDITISNVQSINKSDPNGSQNIKITNVQSLPGSEPNESLRITITNVQKATRRKSAETHSNFADIESIREFAQDASQGITISNIENTSHPELSNYQEKDAYRDSGGNDIGFCIDELVSEHVQKNNNETEVVANNLGFHIEQVLSKNHGRKEDTVEFNFYMADVMSESAGAKECRKGSNEENHEVENSTNELVNFHQETVASNYDKNGESDIIKNEEPNLNYDIASVSGENLKNRSGDDVSRNNKENPSARCLQDIKEIMYGPKEENITEMSLRESAEKPNKEDEFNLVTAISEQIAVRCKNNTSEKKNCPAGGREFDSLVNDLSEIIDESHSTNEIIMDSNLENVSNQIRLENLIEETRYIADSL